MKILNYKILNVKKSVSIIALVSFLISSTFTFDVGAENDRVIYPLKEISKLKCRFDDFSSLAKDCLETLPVLHTKDYTKYIKKDGGYNDYTRLYTVLWGSSYKYGWDVGNGGHQGVDIATAKGTPVYSIADGIVIVAKKDPSWGNVISVQHTIRGKTVVSNYAHLSKMNVSEGKIIKVGTKIGEVGSTGNSSGNHLHFQIDLEHIFHPFYYSWKTCPYGYYEITEKGVCFDELAQHTLDPLNFLETSGAVLDKIQINSIISKKSDVVETAPEVIEIKEQTQQKAEEKNIKGGVNMDIFQKTVHSEIGSSSEDIKNVQKIYAELGYYTGSIDGDYAKLEQAIIEYQLAEKVITSKNEAGAGWFGPKTRAHTKSSYIKSLSMTAAEKREGVEVFIGGDTVTTTTTQVKVEKISRDNILSREEIEKREIEDFIKDNEININLENVGGNLEVGKKFKISLEVLKKINNKKRRPYNGALPGNMTFEVDTETVSVFPTKISYISRGDRDIQLKGLKAGNTTLKIKLGSQVIASYKLRVVGEDVKIYPASAQIISSKSLTLGEEKTGIILFKDTAGKKMINLKFAGTFILETGDDTQVCIKRGELKDASKIYKSGCATEDFVSDPEITYSDTVGGLLLFDFKSTENSKQEINLVGKGSGNRYVSTGISVKIPKGLTQKYEYYDATVAMLEEGIVSGTKKGYFMEDNGLTEREAFTWIKQTLLSIKSNSTNPDTKAQIDKKLVELAKEGQGSYKEITRQKFLEHSYDFLVINDSGIVSIEYQDLQDRDNKKANAIFDKNTTWKDKFGESYFQPKQVVTRGEGAYMLSRALEKSTELYLTLK